MTLSDVYLISPELSMVGLAIAVLVADLVWGRQRWMATAVAIGLAIPLAFTIALWRGLPHEPALFGTLAVDQFALFFKVLVLGVVAVVVLASVDYVDRFSRLQGEYYALILFSATGMMLLAATTELISIYVSLEMTALPLAALVAFLKDDRSSEAGIKFLILGAISSAVLLYGLVLIYGYTGTTALVGWTDGQSIYHPGIFDRIGQLQLEGGVPFGAYALFVGIVLMVAGFGFKLSSVPFQMWVPDVYEGAPTPVVAYLSVASKAAGFAVVLRVFYAALGNLAVDWALLFAVLAAISMTIGNLVAVAQSNIKRLLGYSTIAHAGYIMVGLAAIAAKAPAGSESFGPGSVLFYLGAYAATNLAAFFAIIAISNKVASDRIDDFAGMGHRAPWLAGVLTFSLVSLIGLPPTAGFMGKLFLFTAAVNTDLLWLAVVGVVNSVFSAYYYMRIVRVMYLQPPASEEKVASSTSLRLALAASGIGVLVLGILPGPLMGVAARAVEAILR